MTLDLDPYMEVIYELRRFRSSEEWPESLGMYSRIHDAHMARRAIVHDEGEDGDINEIEIKVHTLRHRLDDGLLSLLLSRIEKLEYEHRTLSKEKERYWGYPPSTDDTPDELDPFTLDAHPAYDTDVC